MLLPSSSRVFPALASLLLVACGSSGGPAEAMSFADLCKAANNGKVVEVPGYFSLPGSVSCSDDACEFYFADQPEGGTTHDVKVKVGKGANRVRPFGRDLTVSHFDPADVRFGDATNQELKLGDKIVLTARLHVETMKNVATEKMQDYCDLDVRSFKRAP